MNTAKQTKKATKVIKQKKDTMVSSKIYFEIFREEDLLKYDQLKKLKTSVLPNEKANIVGNVLAKYCFINNGVLYTINKYDVYERFESIKMQDGKLKTMVTQILEASYTNLSDEAKDGLKGDNQSAFVSMMNSKGINNYWNWKLFFQKTM
jgi:hypothetical protein